MNLKSKSFIAIAVAIATVGVSQYVSSQGAIVKFAEGTALTALEIAWKELSPLMTPAKGFTTWYNNTDQYIDVKTYDEKDAVRWVPYETRRIAPKQTVQLQARGVKFIRVIVRQNGATYDSELGQAYLWNGQNAYPKVN